MFAGPLSVDCPDRTTRCCDGAVPDAECAAYDHALAREGGAAKPRFPGQRRYDPASEVRASRVTTKHVILLSPHRRASSTAVRSVNPLTPRTFGGNFSPRRQGGFERATAVVERCGALALSGRLQGRPSPVRFAERPYYPDVFGSGWRKTRPGLARADRTGLRGSWALNDCNLLIGRG